MNICGLRRAHKIHLCKQGIEIALKNGHIRFDFLSFNEVSCRKYGVSQSKVNRGIINNPQIKNELSMIRCPPLKTAHMGGEGRSEIKL